jgi:hypothetical protein
MPEIDVDKLLAHADDFGLKSTVTSVLELHALASEGRHPSDFASPTPGTQLLNHCLMNLHGGLEVEASMRSSLRMGSLGYDWQKNPVTLFNRIRLAGRRLMPSLEDHYKFRMLGPFRFPMAIFIRVMHQLTRAARRWFRT